MASCLILDEDRFEGGANVEQCKKATYTAHVIEDESRLSFPHG
jgi:hypothetical protein